VKIEILSLKTKCEICKKEHSIIVRHHIQSRSKNGSDHPSNIAHLCPNCHADVHNGIIVIEGRFNSTDGNILVFRKWNEKTIITENVPEVWLYPNSKKKRKNYIY
jgi:uncharacterized protein YlaI